MSKLLKYSLLLFYVLLTSCTDVVDVDVPMATPKLVVEASIDWELGTMGNRQTIYLSLSTSYFENNKQNIVTGASVKITNNSTNQVFVFEDQNNGAYTTNSFRPVVNQSYSLEIIYNNDIYTATETLMPVVPIDFVSQSKNQGFNKDALEVNVLFTDPAQIENFYLIKFTSERILLPALFDISDEFTDGNQMNVFYESEDFEVGDAVNIALYGISKQYYNYIRLLIEQSSEGGPFSTIPAQLKGNCINTTNPAANAFGYFRLTQVSKVPYVFK
ncbi:DUF4249 domain-containing protein [Lutibacter sp. HS1-25]|uniref:DUF4249 domain-containing protein n=1 Tax=Lutibacter sp. HS1-25 TaxID=2485000 RepID=UPI0010110C06|nr:DUF4249 domain-containing protein [Lutibacter sp. HS1-25]RXP57906.1 DUF4249 domain-containing protein [Lutibacter sp. HS1-25]